MDEPLVRYDGSGTSNKRWLHADERGSIIAHSNVIGSLIQTNTYDEFGVPGASNDGLFQYTGQVWLEDAGVYSYKNRTYHAELGVFMQTDPIGQSGGINLYAYVGGDAINFVDPLGLKMEPPESSGQPGPEDGCPFSMYCSHTEYRFWLASPDALRFAMSFLKSPASGGSKEHSDGRQERESCPDLPIVDGSRPTDQSFGSAEDAVFAISGSAWKATIAQGVEFGGYITSENTENGRRYSLTETVRGTRSRVNLLPHYPRSGTVVGYWHTHPSGIVGFSEGDTGFLNLIRGFSRASSRPFAFVIGENGNFGKLRYSSVGYPGNGRYVPPSGGEQQGC